MLFVFLPAFRHVNFLPKILIKFIHENIPFFNLDIFLFSIPKDVRKKAKPVIKHKYVTVQIFPSMFAEAFKKETFIFN